MKFLDFSLESDDRVSVINAEQEVNMTTNPTEMPPT
jgi:hypothetical protein